MNESKIIKDAFIDELSKNANWQKAVKEIYTKAKGVAGKELEHVTGRNVEKVRQGIKNTEGYKATGSIPPKAQSLIDKAKKQQNQRLYGGAGLAAALGFGAGSSGS